MHVIGRPEGKESKGCKGNIKKIIAKNFPKIMKAAGSRSALNPKQNKNEETNNIE